MQRQQDVLHETSLHHHARVQTDDLHQEIQKILLHHWILHVAQFPMMNFLFSVASLLQSVGGLTTHGRWLGQLVHGTLEFWSFGNSNGIDFTV